MKSIQKTVVLTGGPAGGKTSFVTLAKGLIDGLNEKARKEGSPSEYRLLVQPEIATLLHSAGVALDGHPLSLDAYIVQELVSRLRGKPGSPSRKTVPSSSSSTAVPWTQWRLRATSSIRKAP